MPGAGKTMMVSIVVQFLHGRLRTEISSCVAYIYCDDQQEKKQSVHNLLSSLLEQLVRGKKDLPRAVSDLYQSYQETRTNPSYDEFIAAIIECSGLSREHTC